MRRFLKLNIHKTAFTSRSSFKAPYYIKFNARQFIDLKFKRHFWLVFWLLDSNCWLLEVIHTQPIVNFSLENDFTLVIISFYILTLSSWESLHFYGNLVRLQWLLEIRQPQNFSEIRSNKAISASFSRHLPVSCPFFIRFLNEFSPYLELPYLE